VADTSWMQLFLDVDGSTETGWYGYDFIVNHKAGDDFSTTVAKYSGTDGKYVFTECGKVSYRVKGNQMMIAVPMEMLGVEFYNQISLQFKWADSDTLYDEMADFYVDGDVAPLGRLNYVYQNYIPGVSADVKPAKVITMAEKAAGEENYFGVVTTDTESQEAPETAPETESDTQELAPTTCKAVAGGMLVFALIGMGALVLKKKRD